MGPYDSPQFGVFENQFFAVVRREIIINKNKIEQHCKNWKVKNSIF